MGCPKKTYAVLFLVGWSTECCKFLQFPNLPTGTRLNRKELMTPASELNGVLEIYNESKLKCLH